MKPYYLRHGVSLLLQAVLLLLMAGLAPSAENKKSDGQAILDALGKGIADAIQQSQKAGELAAKANAAVNKNQFSEALALAEEALKNDSRNEIALIEKGRALRGLGRMNEAIAHFEKSVARFPKSARLHNFLGGTYERAGQPAKAIAALQTAAKLDPKNALYLTNQVSAYITLGDLAGAETVAKAALTVDPKLATAHNNLAEVYLKQGRVAEGIAEYEESLRLRPNSQATKTELAAAREQLRTGNAPSSATKAVASTSTVAPKASASAPTPAAAVPVAPPPTETDSTPVSWRGQVSMKVGAGEHEAGRDIAVSFTADSAAPMLWFGLVEKGQPAETGAWTERVVQEQKSGVVTLRAPAVPGDYEVRVFAGLPAVAPEVATAATVRVALPKSADDIMPMADVEDPPEELIPPPAAPAEPPLLVKRVAQATTAAFAEALQSGHAEWLANEARPEQANLQLEAESPAVVSHLSLRRVKTGLEAELALQLSRERAKALIDDAPLAVLEVKAREKSPALFRLGYTEKELPQATAALAALLAESNALGHPAARSTKKKATAAPSAAAARPVSAIPATQTVVTGAKKLPPGPWEESDWNWGTPLPVHKGRPTGGLREYYMTFAGKNFMMAILLDARFEYHPNTGLRFTWVNHSLPTGLSATRSSKQLPLLDGAIQDNSARPHVDLPSAKDGREVITRIQRPRSTKTKKSADSAQAAKPAQTGRYQSVEKTADAPISLDDGEPPAPTILRTCKVVFQHEVKSRCEGNRFTLVYERVRRITAWEREQTETAPAAWVPINEPSEVDERIEITGTFDPVKARFAGNYIITRRPFLGEEWIGEPVTKGEIECYGTEYAKLLPYQPEERPVWIVELDAPKNLIKPDPFKLPLRFKANSTPQEAYMANSAYPYTLSLIDLVTGENVVAPLTGAIGLGAEESKMFAITPPAMSGEWRLRARLQVKHHIEEQDVAVNLGGFPARFVKNAVTPRVLTAGGAVVVDMEMVNVWPKSSADTPEARATGSWGLCDLDTGDYLPITKGSSQPLFDLLPGKGKRASVAATSPANREGHWRLALVMWDLAGKMVGFRELPPVRLNPSLTQLAEKQAALLAAEGKPSAMDLMWIAETQGRYRDFQQSLAAVKAKIAQDEKSLKDAQAADPEVAARYKARIAELGEQREVLFARLDETMQRSLGYFNRRLKETPPNSEAARALASVGHDVMRQAKSAKLDALASRRDPQGLVDVIKQVGSEDPILTAEAFRRLADLELENPAEGSRANALQCLLSACKMNPNDAEAASTRQRLEKTYLKDVYAKYQIDMTEAQRKFEYELGNHGEAGYWGAFYDLAKTGIGTGAQNAAAQISGEQSSIEAVAEVMDRIEQEVGVQQAGVLMLRRLVDAGLPIADAGKLDIKQLYAVRALARNGLAPGCDPAKLKGLTDAERAALGQVPPAQLQRVFPALKKLMDSGQPISNQGLAAGLGSLRAALRNPDIKALAAGQTSGLAVDSAEPRGYLKSADTLELSLTEKGIRGVADMANVINAASFVPGVSTSAGGVTVMQAFAGGVAKVAPGTARYLTAVSEARQGMSFATQFVADTFAGCAVSYAAGKATGDEKIAELAGDFFGLGTGAFDAEWVARGLVKKGVEKALVSGVRQQTAALLKRANAPELRLDDLVRQVAKDLDAGHGAQALSRVKAKSAIFTQALSAELPEGARTLRQSEAALVEQLAQRLDAGDLPGAKNVTRLLDTTQSANNALLRRTEARAAALAQVEQRMLGARTLSAKADELKGEFLATIGRRTAPGSDLPLSDAEVNELLKNPNKVREYIDAGLLPGVHEQQIAARNAERLFQARRDAMDDLYLENPEYAQLFHHFRDTGSWPKGKTFRDADMTAKLEVEPPEKLLRALYEKRGLGAAATRPYKELLEIYKSDDALKRDVLMKFRENLGFHVGRLHGHPGAPQQVLKEYDIVLNEIPGAPHLLGGRRMSAEEYRLKQGFSRAEALLGPDSKVCTRVMFDKNGGMKLRPGFRVDEVRLPGDVPLKLEPKHSLAKVYDEWMMFWDHSTHAISDWDRVQKVGKYPGRVNDELAYLLHAPDTLVPPKAKQALAKMQDNFSGLFAEWKAIKSQAGDIGYAAATEKVLQGRIGKFRAQFPTATDAQLKEMAGGEYLKECQSYFRAMTSVTKLVPGASSALSRTDAVGAPFHEYMRQNIALRHVIVFP